MFAYVVPGSRKSFEEPVRDWCKATGGSYGTNISYCVMSYANGTQPPPSPVSITTLFTLPKDPHSFPISEEDQEKTIESIHLFTSLDWEKGIELYVRNDGYDDFYQAELSLFFQGCTTTFGIEYKYYVNFTDGTGCWMNDPKSKETEGLHGNSYVAPQLLSKAPESITIEEMILRSRTNSAISLYAFERVVRERQDKRLPPLPEGCKPDTFTEEDEARIREKGVCPARDRTVPFDVMAKPDLPSVKIAGKAYLNMGDGEPTEFTGSFVSRDAIVKDTETPVIGASFGG